MMSMSIYICIEVSILLWEKQRFEFNLFQISHITDKIRVINDETSVLARSYKLVSYRYGNTSIQKTLQITLK